MFNTGLNSSCSSVDRILFVFPVILREIAKPLTTAVCSPRAIGAAHEESSRDEQEDEDQVVTDPRTLGNLLTAPAKEMQSVGEPASDEVRLSRVSITLLGRLPIPGLTRSKAKSLKSYSKFTLMFVASIQKE
jgi:hypothetical protein